MTEKDINKVNVESAAPKETNVVKKEDSNIKAEITDAEFEKMSLAEQFEAKDGSWTVALAPHLRTTRTTRKMMLDVIIALTPQLLFSVYKFGLHAARCKYNFSNWSCRCCYKVCSHKTCTKQ